MKEREQKEHLFRLFYCVSLSHYRWQNEEHFGIYSAFWDTVYPKSLCLSRPVPLHCILMTVSDGREGCGVCIRLVARGKSSSNSEADVEQSLLGLEVVGKQCVQALHVKSSSIRSR